MAAELITRCERCYGEGRIGFFGLSASIECPACHGTGHVEPHPMREPIVYRLEQTDDQLEEGAR
jgi:DnaJ-class molecular chaperone